MAGTDASARKISVADLRKIVVDADELRKGMEAFDRGGLKNLARYGAKLFGEAAGSGAMPYKVTLAFNEAGDVKARCTCKAAWSRPFCKHGAGLLVAWARSPEAFVVTEGPPAGSGDDKKTAAAKRGKVDPKDLLKQGAAQVVTLTRELGAAGVAAIGEDRLPQLEKLGENLREFKLRRLAARALDLAALLSAAEDAGTTVPAVAYTDLVADLLLTARKLEKHAGGEPLDPRHVEELVGKTWQKGDLEPLTGLDLIEYAYEDRVTSDGFAIQESRLFDLASGVHYSEKQITPLHLSRAEAKPRRGGAVLAGLRGGRYPGYPPRRLKITDLGDRRPIDHDALARVFDRALPDVGAALAALSEHRKDVFAPDRVPVALRVDTLFARGGRLQAVDAAGHALHLPDARDLEDRLGSALGGARLAVLIGDLGIEAALPTIFPLAAVVEGPLGYELRLLAGADTPSGALPEAGSAAWIRAAREAGASGAAIALAEIREELAKAFVMGLAALTPRLVDPIAARLGELGLAKPAALLTSLAAAPVEARLDDFIKLYQVLGIALLRLAGAAEVDREALVRVPTYESVFVKRPDAWLDPDRTTDLRRAGAIGRYEAALQYAHYYETLPRDELAANIYPTWADGSAAPYVVRALADRRDEAVAAAQKALSGKGGRMAKITALRVLAAAGGLTAERVLHEVTTRPGDVGMRALAIDARDAIEMRALGPEAVQKRRAPMLAAIAELAGKLAGAPDADTRAGILTTLVDVGSLAVLPVLRQVYLADASREVRREAALGLALLGDAEMVDTFVSILQRRGDDDREAKVAASVLGVLGDVRGLRELLRAFAEGYKPGVIAEALRAMGPVAVDPLLALIESQPKLADRAAAKTVLHEIPDADLADALVTRVRARAAAPGFDDLGLLYLKLAAVHPFTRRAVAQAVLVAVKDEAAHKALVKAARKGLG